MTELFFVLTAVVLIGVILLFARQKNQAPAVNRYRKTKKTIRNQTTRSTQSYTGMRSLSEKNPFTDMPAPELSKTQSSHIVPESSDADYVLGLKTSEKYASKSLTEHAKSTTHKPVDCVIALYLMASDNCVYGGYELLQSLLSVGLRYGKQRIFHRHAHKDGRGNVLFHCASALAPGTFDLTKMGAFTTKGFCFFFSADAVEDPLAAFDCLLETLDQLIEDLGGRVLDDQRVLLTKERVAQYRQRLRTVMNNHTTADMFNG